MHSTATRSLYALVDRLAKLGRSQVFGDAETPGALATFALLFQEKWSNGETLVRMTDVSRQLLISKPAATQTVNRLVERGLVERVSDENDRRVVYIRATEAGRNFFETQMDKNLDLVDRVVVRMGEDDANKLAALLNHFFDAITAETED